MQASFPCLLQPAEEKEDCNTEAEAQTCQGTILTAAEVQLESAESAAIQTPGTLLERLTQGPGRILDCMDFSMTTSANF